MKYLIATILICICFSCKKYLDEKPDKKLATPTTLADFQALLDNFSRINQRDPNSWEVSADDYYLTDQDWESLSDDQRRMYLWEKDYLFVPLSNDWSNSYNIVYFANTVLEGLDQMNVDVNSLNDYNNIKGQACFLRAKAFLQNLFIWAPAYDQATSSLDLGIPLRLTTDFNIKTTRASVENSYQQVITDLKQSAILLPESPIHVIRPSKAAAYALLSRTYLSMRQYESAKLYADSCLKIKNVLLDYNDSKVNKNNTANPTQYAFVSFAFSGSTPSPEIIYESRMILPLALSNSKAKIDSTLVKSFGLNDYRKDILFRNFGDGTYGFRGSYEGGQNLFTGLSVNEIYLIRAECLARANNKDAAMDDLNALLVKRWKGSFTNLSANTPAEALSKILEHRRKELLMRGLRWMDIKRLNKEGASIVLQRKIKGQIYILQPNDSRYALPIPEDIISLTGIAQNPR